MRGTTALPQNSVETAHEEELIQRVKNGDHDLFYELIQPYEGRVYAAALAIVRNEADAEDIAQDAFLKAFRHLAQFRGEARFSTWLLQITVNQARMRKRRTAAHAMESINDHENDEGNISRANSPTGTRFLRKVLNAAKFATHWLELWHL